MTIAVKQLRTKKGTPATGVAGVFLILALLFALTGCGSSMSENEEESLQSDLVIKTSGVKHLFKVELALDDRAHAKGLMFRRTMATDHGMLFIYDHEQMIGMWMKNTVLSLDMLFVKRNGLIVTIAKNTEPFSKTVLSSSEPVFAVLELNSGTTDRLSIQVGDRLIHPLLGSD